jgi:hypothetical protein
VERSVALFAYGTLQLPAVQRATFGRLLDGEPDTLPGYALAPLEIKDEHVVATSGLAIHSMACATGDPADRIPGVVFAITPDELAAADAYEVDDMKRIEVELASGRQAFVYIGVSE